MADRNAGDVATGLLVGAAAGLAAAWTMDQFQAAVAALEDEGGSGGGEPSTVKAARGLSLGVLGLPLPEEDKEAAGQAVHYATGAVLGAAYGALAVVEPRVASGGGSAYGAAAWAVGDEGLVPLLGLSGPPTEAPASSHAYALASHLVFGAALEGSRRLLLSLLGDR